MLATIAALGLVGLFIALTSTTVVRFLLGLIVVLPLASVIVFLVFRLALAAILVSVVVPASVVIAVAATTLALAPLTLRFCLGLFFLLWLRAKQ